jgi:hypothetical protein
LTELCQPKCMARPKKYDWSVVRRLHDQGESLSGIARLTGIPRQSIQSFLKAEAAENPAENPAAPSPVSPTGKRIEFSAGAVNDRATELCPTREELERIRGQNRAAQYLADLEAIDRDQPKLGRALQSMAARFLAGDRSIKACDLSHVGAVLTAVGNIPRKDELGDAILTFMKYGFFTPEVCAHLSKEISGDRDASLSNLRAIVQREPLAIRGQTSPPPV